MEEERVLIYRDQDGLKGAVIGYNVMQNRLQKLHDAIKGLGVQPTVEMLYSIAFEGNWTPVNVELEKQLAAIPSTTLYRIAYEGQQQTISEIKDHQVKDVLEAANKYLPPMEHFSVVDSVVTINPEVKKILEEQYSIYADSEGRKSVLAALKNLREAQEALDQAVAAAAKREATRLEKKSKAGEVWSQIRHPEEIRGLRPIGEFALAALDVDGRIVLKGENFSYLK